jgi:hypothetical protein
MVWNSVCSMVLVLPLRLTSTDYAKSIFASPTTTMQVKHPLQYREQTRQTNCIRGDRRCKFATSLSLPPECILMCACLPLTAGAASSASCLDLLVASFSHDTSGGGFPFLLFGDPVLMPLLLVVVFHAVAKPVMQGRQRARAGEATGRCGWAGRRPSHNTSFLPRATLLLSPAVDLIWWRGATLLQLVDAGIIAARHHACHGNKLIDIWGSRHFFRNVICSTTRSTAHVLPFPLPSTMLVFLHPSFASHRRDAYL